MNPTKDELFKAMLYLLAFAVNNAKNFTGYDPDGVIKSWIEQAREIIAEARRVA